MTLDDLLARLQGVRRNASGQHSALCPAHEDRSPSLSVREADGKILVRCHAGCDIDAVLAALGLKKSDLFVVSNGGGGKPRKRRLCVVAQYEYEDENGKLIHDVVRLSPKGFRQRVRGDNGQWVWKLPKGCRRVPYRLPQLIAAPHDATIFVVEGERDVETLEKLGVVATTNSGGAGRWGLIDPAALKAAFTGRRVAVIPDGDEPGEAHARDIARSLVPVAAEVKIARLPSNVKDVTELVELRDAHTPEEIREEIEGFVADAKPITDADLGESAEQESETEAGAVNGLFAGIGSDPEAAQLTDVGNGMRLARLNTDGIIHVHPWKKWFIWNGRIWDEDQRGEISARAKSAARVVLAEGLSHKSKRKLWVWGMKSQGGRKINAAVGLAASEPGVPVLPAELDNDLLLLNAPNGIVDLKTGEIRPHDRKLFMTKLAGVEYQPDAKAPRWEKFLLEIMEGKRHLVDFLQRAIGYAASGDPKERKLIVLVGCGANGKTVFVERVAAALGDYAWKSSKEVLLHKDRPGVPNDIAALRGRRFVWSSELEEGSRLGESLIKEITGGERLSARFLYCESFNFPARFVPFVTSNHRPEIRGTDDGIWDRISLVPFDRRFDGDEKDLELPAKLDKELPGILAWIVRGSLLWQKSGLAEPDEVKAATGAYRAEQDPVAAFLQDCAQVGMGLQVTTALLSKRYREWAKNCGALDLSATALGKRLREKGFRPDKDNNDRRVWIGLRMLSTADSDD